MVSRWIGGWKEGFYGNLVTLFLVFFRLPPLPCKRPPSRYKVTIKHPSGFAGGR